MTSTSPPSPRIDMDAGQQQQPPAPPFTAPERPPLRRSTTDKMVGGVCGGLAEHTGIDSLVWRVGFVGFTFVGAGILVYLLLWVLMPPGQQTPVQQPGPLDRLDRLAEQAHEKVYATGWLPPRG